MGTLVDKIWLLQMLQYKMKHLYTKDIKISDDNDTTLRQKIKELEDRISELEKRI